MKKVIIIIIAALSISTVSAQGFYFGVRGGMNVSSFTKTTDAAAVVRGNVGAFGGFQISTIAAVQLEAAYSFQGSKIDNMDNQTDYLKIPIMVKIYLIKGLNLEAGISFNILTSSLFNGNIDKELQRQINGFDFAIPVGIAYQFGRHFELGARYDISTVAVKNTHKGANSNFSVNVAWRF